MRFGKIDIAAAHDGNKTWGDALGSGFRSFRTNEGAQTGDAYAAYSGCR
jgi:hypothetical protein